MNDKFFTVCAASEDFPRCLPDCIKPFQCVWPLLHVGARGEFGGGKLEKMIKAYSVLTVPHAKIYIGFENYLLVY